MKTFCLCLLVAMLATAPAEVARKRSKYNVRMVENMLKRLEERETMLGRREEAKVFGLTQAEHDLALKQQNDFRRTVDASNMEKLRYNMVLAAMAHNLTQSCAQRQWFPDDWPNQPFEWGMLGQNHYATSADSLDVKMGVKAFYDEWVNYDYDSNSCSVTGDCDRYTQLMWADTTLVGCAASFCPQFTSITGSIRTNMIFFACNYGVAGNYHGVKPWKEGPACSECGSGTFWCDTEEPRGLCNSQYNGTTSVPEGVVCKGSCKNGAVSCACDCQCSSGYMGKTCDEVCRNTDAMCGDDYGYGEWMCEPSFGYRQVMVKKCPATCGLCGTASPTACDFAVGGK